MHKIVSILILFVCVLPAMAQDRELRVSGMLAYRAVLQCGKPVPVWGRAAAGARIVVEFAGQNKTATADSDGAWLVTLDPMTASLEPSNLVVKQAGKPQTITIHNVLVGDVWLLAGGREMLKRLKDDEFGADAPVRIFYAAHATSPEGKVDIAGRWMPVSTASLKGLPAEDWQSQNRAVLQGQLLAAMIGHWRQAFGDLQLPFVVVQLPPHRYAVPFGIDGRLAAELRDGQREAVNVADRSAIKALDRGAIHDYHPPRHTHLAVTIDLGPDPHPRQLAERIAETIVNPQSAGPELDRAETNGSEVILHFRNTEGGLKTLGGGELKGFAIADSMFRWCWADARIESDTVVLSAPTIEQPQGVRYAWEDLPSRGANLCNGAGRPAAPFRTDDHPSCTADNIDPSFPVLRFSPRKDLGVEDPRLPRILIIGDSISGHYHYGVRERMRGRANVIGESSMRKGTWASMAPNFYRSDWASRGDDLKNFLAERGPFDIVHFNNGIHNFARAKPGDEKPYAEQLRKVVATIRESDAICLFANSTGTVADNTIPKAPNYLTNCRAFNAAAEEVMRELNVPLTDIYGLIQPRIEELISRDLIHTNKEADEMMADLIAKRLTETLTELRK